MGEGTRWVVLENFRQGGPIMWPLLFCSVLALGFILERAWKYWQARGKISIEDFIQRVRQIFQKTPEKEVAVEQSLKFCEEVVSPATNILKAGLIRYKECLNKKIAREKWKGEIEEAIENAGREEIPLLEAYLPLLETVGRVSPLLGLLGTIMGMIKAFRVIALRPGGARPDELAGGISEALITTATGLMIAIPVIAIYSLLRAKVDNYIRRVELASVNLIETLLLE